MKAKLIFNLDNPDDREEYCLINNAQNMYSALFQINCNLKRQLERKLEDEVSFNTLELVFQEINTIFEEYKINIQ